MSKKRGRIYVCHTFYHLYISFLKEFNQPEEEKKPNKPTEAAQSTPEPEPEPTASEPTKPSAPEPKKPTQPSPVPSKPSTTDAAKPASDNRR